MSARVEAFARCGWLDDPVTQEIGSALVALLLALAARAAERGHPGELAASEWVYHVDPCQADAAVRAGLVTLEPHARRGYVVRFESWVLAQVDTDRAIVRRVQTRARVRRLRARRRGDDDSQLDLFDDGESEAFSTAVEVVPVNGIACAKPLGANVDVTHPVTQFAPRTLYPRASAPAVPDQDEDQITRSDVARDSKQWTATGAGGGLRLLMAIVGNVGGSAIERRRLNPDERRALLDRVRSTCKRAHFTIPPERAIVKAIELTRRYRRA